MMRCVRDWVHVQHVWANLMQSALLLRSHAMGRILQWPTVITRIRSSKPFRTAGTPKMPLIEGY